MRLLTTLALLGLPLLVASQDINFVSTCFTGGFTLAATVNGRNEYIDDDGDDNTDPSLRIAYNAAATRWEVQVINDPSTVFYATETNDFAPNPPSSDVATWTGMSGCDGTATVTGDGTQATAGDGPNCDAEGGDADADGICDANDVCPDGDDTVDPDGDGLPSACDPDATNFNGVTVTSDCFGAASPLNFRLVGADTTGRNRYRNDPVGLEIAYNADSLRWELRDADTTGRQIYYSNALATQPNPPATVLAPWMAGVCANDSDFAGTGTQAVVPTIDCPTDSVTLFLDATCAVLVPDLTAGVMTNLTNTPVFTQDSAAGTPLFGGGNTTTFTVTVRATDVGGNFADCAVTLTLVDTLAPQVQVANDTLVVALGPDGTQRIAPTDLALTLGDNCAPDSTDLRLEGADAGAAFLDFDCQDIGGVSPVVVSQTDLAGNVGRDTFLVRVVDTIPPDLVCRNDTIYLDSTGVFGFAIGDLVEIVADNCPPEVMVGNPLFVYGRDDVGTITSVETRVDPSGNGAVCTVNLTVVDSFNVSSVDYWQSAEGPDLLVYPNPNGGRFSVDHPPGSELRLLDVTGRLVWSATTATTEIDVALPPGIYLLTALTARRGWRRWVTIR